MLAGREHEVKETIKAIETEIRFEGYSGCFWCGVPQEICHWWESNSSGRYQRMFRFVNSAYAGRIEGLN
jgi:hypothetical protein